MPSRSELNCSGCFDLNGTIDLTYARNTLHNLECVDWKHDVTKVPKLRTYILYKTEYSTEPYVAKINNRGHKSALAQFRCGILPLSIETGRFNNIPLD